jgi:acetylornithine deacetylase
MKAGVAAALAAAASLSNADMTGELIVALTADEEHASIGMQHLVRSGVAADGAIVCEPTELSVMPAHKGFLWVDFAFKGHAAHGSRPDVGVDAIVHAGAVLMSLADESDRLGQGTTHPLLGPASIHAGTISGGSAPSVYPDRCDLTVERRTLPGETQEEVMAEVNRVVDAARARIPDLEVQVSAGLFRAGTEIPTSDPLVTGLAQAMADAGLDERIEGMSAWVDACFLNQAGIPALCFGPGSIAQAHTAEEWVSVDQIRACQEVLTSWVQTHLT